ncbi:complex I assembly factor ACAD9, mitochondrial [Bombus bifarius]|uniref:Complex I assembly factor ACAD9, mitochondrial n=1 Tax=Bombus bifarius TaxID=103933 RepID=A0A6P8MMR3_9HYME|nr:complex I assembly factor ACAD9, mitochondrial [Bombus bifarius]
MMLSQKLLQNSKILSLKSNYILKRYLKEAVELPPNYQETKLQPLPEQKPERISFLRALITGEIDSDVFMYPEQISPRYEDYFTWIKPIESYISHCTNKNVGKNEMLDHLRELGVFRTHIGEKYFGLSLSKTESLKLVELLSNFPWLGTYMIKNHILPIEIIDKYGSNSQKLEYYPKIMSGDIIPTVCVHEGDYGSNIGNIETYAMQHTDDSWLLNGKKSFVVNGINSNLFLVFAKHIARNTGKSKPTSFSLFLVEKDFGNVSCTNVYDTIGRHETPTCTISFEDTIVPNKNIIGTPGDALDVLMEYMKPGRQNISGQAISILRNFLNQLIPDIIHKKHFDRDLYKFDVVKRILGEISFCLYTMESMAYLTTGMIDDYKNMNADVEEAIIETYCANNCLKCIQSGLQLVGARSYMKNQSYIEAFHDAMALTTMDINNLDANTFASASVIQFLGQTVSGHIYKKRNSFQFPFYNMFDKMFDRYMIKLNAGEYFHPTFKYAVAYMEDAINRLKDAILILFEEEGTNIIERYTDLQRITTMLTEIYATYANLTRASRSYCIGARNSDLEKDLAIKMAFVSHIKICEIQSQINNTSLFNGDKLYSDAMDLVYEQRKYSLAHPLTKTF